MNNCESVGMPVQQVVEVILQSVPPCEFKKSFCYSVSFPKPFAGSVTRESGKCVCAGNDFFAVKKIVRLSD